MFLSKRGDTVRMEPFHDSKSMWLSSQPKPLPTIQAFPTVN